MDYKFVPNDVLECTRSGDGATEGEKYTVEHTVVVGGEPGVKLKDKRAPCYESRFKLTRRKFEIGDRVVAVATGHNDDPLTIGTNYEISHWWDDGTLGLEGNDEAQKQDCVQPVKAESAVPTETTYEFKAGDEVECIKAVNMKLKEGQKYTINRIDGSGCLKLNELPSGAYRPHRFKLVEPKYKHGDVYGDAKAGGSKTVILHNGGGWACSGSDIDRLKHAKSSKDGWTINNKEDLGPFLYNVFDKAEKSNPSEPKYNHGDVFDGENTIWRYVVITVNGKRCGTDAENDLKPHANRTDDSGYVNQFEGNPIQGKFLYNIFNKSEEQAPKHNPRPGDVFKETSGVFTHVIITKDGDPFYTGTKREDKILEIANRTTGDGHAHGEIGEFLYNVFDKAEAPKSEKQKRVYRIGDIYGPDSVGDYAIIINKTDYEWIFKDTSTENCIKTLKDHCGHKINNNVDAMPFFKNVHDGQKPDTDTNAICTHDSPEFRVDITYEKEIQL